MKFFCTKENLSKSLSLISGVAGKNINLPILGNVLIKANEQKVELIGTNLELAIISNLRSKVEEPGVFTVPARTLNDFVNLLSEEKVELSLNNNELEVICGRSSTRIKGSPADEFPVVPTGSEGKGYLIDVDDFKKGLNQVVHAAAKNEIRPELAGVFFGFNEDTGYLTMAATDSYRLAEKKIKLLQGEEKIKTIIPSRTAQEIIHVLSITKGFETEKNARVIMSDNQIVVRYDEVELISRLVEGQYPDYAQIIPHEFRTEAEFLTSHMIKEIKAASLFTTTGVNAVTFELKPKEGNVIISSVSSQTGTYKSELSSEMKGDENSILLNHRYVLDGLINMESEKVWLRVINADSPCVFAPFEDKTYLYIVMPIRQ